MTFKNQKNAIEAKFSAAAESYDRYAFAQEIVAEQICRMASIYLNAEKILEAGCGTGLLTGKLMKALPDASINALDISGKMIDQARNRLTDSDRITWIVGDILNFKSESDFDLIVSSSSLHWIVPLSKVFKALRSVLKNNGLLIFGIMTDGTLSELHKTRTRITPFKPMHINLPKPEKVKEVLINECFSIIDSKKKSLHINYQSASHLLHCIHKQGLTGGFISSHNMLLNKSELQALVSEYNTRYKNGDDGVSATYEILYITCRKEAQ